MKIAFITNLYPPYNRGGAEKVVKNIVSGLAAEGHEVFVVTARPFSSLKSLTPKLSMEEGIKVYRYYPLNLFFYGNDYKHNFLTRLLWHFFDVYNFSSAKKTENILLREKPDLIFTHNLKGLGFQIMKNIGKLKNNGLKNLKHVHTIHDQQLAVPKGYVIYGEEKSFANNNFFVKKYEKICKDLFASPNLVISPSKFLLKYYLNKKFFKDSKTAIIPNPVKLSFKKPEYLPAEDKSYNFLFVGQIEYHKGITFLIDTFKNLKAKNVYLNIVGTGSKINLITKLALQDKRIIIHGELQKDRLAQIYAKADYLIVPSLCYENSPTVIYEAFNLGVPVLASNIGGVSELVKNEKNGFVFEAGNSLELLHLFEKIMQPVTDWNYLSENARHSVSEYTVKNYIMQILDLAKDL